MSPQRKVLIDLRASKFASKKFTSSMWTAENCVNQF